MANDPGVIEPEIRRCLDTAYGVAWYVYRRREQTLPSLQAGQLIARARSTGSEADAGVARARAQLAPLLTLRIDRDMSWKDIAVVLGGGVDPPTLRKRFERLRVKVGKLVQGGGG